MSSHISDCISRKSDIYAIHYTMDDVDTISGLAYLVSDRGAVTPREAAEALGLEEKEVLDLAKLLASENIIMERYSVTGDITLDRGDRIKDASREDLDGYIRETLAKKAERGKEEDSTAAEIIAEIREKIRSKRYRR